MLLGRLLSTATTVAAASSRPVLLATIASTSSAASSMQFRRGFKVDKKGKSAEESATTAKKKLKKEEIAADGLPKDYAQKAIRVQSRRLDKIVARIAGKSTAQTEKLIFEGRVRVNEEPVKKRSTYVGADDVVEVWESTVEENTSLVQVTRAEIVDVTFEDSSDLLNVKLWRNYVVPNWKSRD